jgi:HAD superfamily hydrolase (TIGR01509 family)
VRRRDEAHVDRRLASTLTGPGECSALICYAVFEMALTSGMAPQPAFLFDLDGTLVDSVYQHVLAWHEALESEGISLSIWRVHRRIGMSGGLLINMLLRETGMALDPARIERISARHAEAYMRNARDISPLPGARELLRALTEARTPWAVATSARMETARPTLDLLGLSPERDPIVTRDDVRHAKPDPDLFLAAADRVGIDIEHSTVVGDSVWDMLAAKRARALGIGLLSGGYGAEELERAGAYRVFADPAAMLHHLDELGVRS